MLIDKTKTPVLVWSREEDNDNDEYYLLIQTIYSKIIVRTNIFGKSSAIVLGLLNCT